MGARFTPLLADAARFARHSPGDQWSIDETYVKVAGVWRYVYRAVDQYGQIIDVLVSKRRDGEAARQFFQRALTTLKARPTEVVTDAAPVHPRVLDELVPGRLASRRTVCQQPDRGRPQPPQTPATTDARPMH
jgi:transposase-like protein